MAPRVFDDDDGGLMVLSPWASMLVGLGPEEELIREQGDEHEKVLVVWRGNRCATNGVSFDSSDFGEETSGGVGESLWLRLDALKLEADKVLVDRGAPARTNWAV